MSGISKALSRRRAKAQERVTARFGLGITSLDVGSLLEGAEMASPGLRIGSALWAHRYPGDGSAAIVDEAEALAVQQDGAWSWVHYPLADQRARDRIAQLSEAPAAARTLLLGPDDAPQFHSAAGWTWGMLPDFERELDGRTSAPGRLRFLFDATRLVTTRRHALQCVDDVRRDPEAKVALRCPLDAVVAFIVQYCDVCEDHLVVSARDIDRIEDRVLAVRAEPEQFDLGPVRLLLSRRRREIGALRLGLHRAHTRLGLEAEGPLSGNSAMLVQRVDDVDREISAQEDRARLLHEEIEMRITSATNRTLRTLTVISTLLMPPTLLVGAFGMNLDGILFADNKHGFALATLICCALIAAAWVAIKRIGRTG